MSIIRPSACSHGAYCLLRIRIIKKGSQINVNLERTVSPPFPQVLYLNSVDCIWKRFGEKILTCCKNQNLNLLCASNYFREGDGTPLQYSCLENPWTEGPGRLQSMGSLRVGHDWTTSLSLFTFMHWRRKWQPTPVFLPGESQGRGSLVVCRLWGGTESDMTEAT